jgi:hypothetical protein
MPKIIEGLKRLKVLEKRIAGVGPEVTKYAAIFSNQKPAFETEAEQTKQIMGLLQSAEDLQVEYLNLKRDIDYTNTVVIVEIGGKHFSLNELLTIKRKTAQLMMSVYKALNVDGLIRSGLRGTAGAGESIKVVQLYDEKMKNEKLAAWQDLYDNVESKMEVYNAVLDLVPAPK